MQFGIFSVYDDKAKAFLPPFFIPEVGVAVRVFGDAVNDPGHQFFHHPADYTLFRLGSFDDGLGKIVVDEVRETICNGIMLKHRKDDFDIQKQQELRHGGNGLQLPVGQ